MALRGPWRFRHSNMAGVVAVANAGYESQASTAVPGEETYQRLISLRLSIPIGHQC